ncbi:MAG: regulatory iron-sulfur-containing complex subunit RicT [Candidatus Caccosoma sp.]|nr:regulatory iron-sulfur-containing complex subunit RicT [Candidatus Caccosoma sp.]
MDNEQINNVNTEEAVKAYKYVYGVSFKKALQTYYFGSDDDSLKINTPIVVETVRGVELATIKAAAKKIDDVKLETVLKPIIRVATNEDIEAYKQALQSAKVAEKIFNISVNEEKLDMHLVSAEYTLDSTKVIFTYIADERIDFRELLKVLASKLHCRIELKQIGARDRAKTVGGLGPCGLPLCCSTFLSDFEGISINMAKNQLLALNISKLSGQCGKLICCLKYEDTLYSELRVGLPKLGLRCKYKDEEYKITSMNVLSKTMKLENKENSVFITFDEYFKEVSNVPPTKLCK